MGEEESGGVDSKVIFSEGLLAASGFHGLPAVRNLEYAGPAFSISLFAGCIGVLQNITGNDLLIKLHKYTSTLCRTMVVPLIATQVCISKGVQIELAALNLAYPILHYIFKYILENEDAAKSELLELSHTISVGTMAYFYFIDSHEWGIVMSVAYALGTLATSLVGNLESAKTMIALGNFMYALKVL